MTKRQLQKLEKKPNFQILKLTLVGTSPLIMDRCRWYRRSSGFLCPTCNQWVSNHTHHPKAQWRTVLEKDGRLE